MSEHFRDEHRTQMSCLLIIITLLARSKW